MKAAVLVTSDRISRGEEEDRSGRTAAETLAGAAELHELRVVPDDAGRIAAALIEWCGAGVDLILTVGGTGLGPRDVTPEATREVVDREAPGIATALLVRGLGSTHRAMLSRATAGLRGGTLIVNLPGSTSAVLDLVPYLLQVVPHALETARGAPEPYHEPAGEAP